MVLKVIIPALRMGIFIKCFQNISPLALVPSAAILYFAIFYALRGLDKDDTYLFRSFVKREVGR